MFRDKIYLRVQFWQEATLCNIFIGGNDSISGWFWREWLLWWRAVPDDQIWQLPKGVIEQSNMTNMTIAKMCLWTIKYLPLGIRSFRIWINAEDVMSSKSAFKCNVLNFSSKNKKSKIISKTQLFQFSRVVSVLVMIFGGLGVLGNSLAIAVLSRSAQIFVLAPPSPLSTLIFAFHVNSTHKLV